MKIQRLIFLIFTTIVVFACVTDHPSPQVLKISENTLRFSGNGGVWKLTVNSNCEWKITGGDTWCTTVIFHLFYADETDSLQNASGEFFTKMIDECNRLYNTGTNSIPMNLKLVAATEDPAGNPLAEPGIERILKTPAAVMSCEDFMAQSNTSFNSFVWDLNKYINVFVYTFKEKTTAGISHLPYTPRENTLPGLTANNHYFSNMPSYTHCISINNTYITEDNIYVTLAHELGHYLGLFHVFSEQGCNETDYCEDTPNYDRNTYTEWLNTLSKPYTQEVFTRNGCEGESFISTNIMDYFHSYQNRFTANQYSRVRHVLENSPLIPGPKNIITTKVAREDIVPAARAIE